MTSRIDRTFAGIRQRRRGGLVTYLTAGDPTPERSADLLRAVADAGADVLEVGVPFSDPLADGPVIQRATERALAQGMTLRGTLDIIRRVRAAVEAPVVLFTYANPILRMGVQRFAAAAADAGVDGVLVLDYPVEEAEPLRGPIVDAGLHAHRLGVTSPRHDAVAARAPACRTSPSSPAGPPRSRRTSSRAACPVHRAAAG